MSSFTAISPSLGAPGGRRFLQRENSLAQRVEDVPVLLFDAGAENGLIGEAGGGQILIAGAMAVDDPAAVEDKRIDQMRGAMVLGLHVVGVLTELRF